MAKKHSEFAYVAMCTQPGAKWFAMGFIMESMKRAREEFVTGCTGKVYSSRDWKMLRDEGWKIVRVKITTT